MGAAMRRPVMDRLMAKVEQTDSCWLWTGAQAGNGSKEGKGYGIIGSGEGANGPAYVHRVVYEHIIGSIPDGLEIDHVCRTRNCVNPDHLEAVTHQENRRRARQTYCKRGHVIEDQTERSTRRGCRTCDALRTARYRAARRAEALV